MSGGTSIPVARLELAPAQPVLELDPGSASRREWIRSLWDHRGVIWVLARKDFQARYKRASLGVLWAVSVPLMQAVVMIFVFSHFIRIQTGISYAAFVLSGVMTWSYVTLVLPQATTSIVDGTSLTDKLWFPRAILSIVPCLSNLVGLGISMVILLIAVPVLGVHPSLHLLLLVPACLLLLVFAMSLTMVLSALNVYFRDVRFIVVATLTAWMYATPIMYPKSVVGSLGNWLDFNPMTGIISLFHLAVVGQVGSWTRALVVSLITTAALLVAAMEVHRRHDRLFVDLL
jgi:lipopolysaccharide transport system permease protein